MESTPKVGSAGMMLVRQGFPTCAMGRQAFQSETTFPHWDIEYTNITSSCSWYRQTVFHSENMISLWASVLLSQIFGLDTVQSHDLTEKGRLQCKSEGTSRATRCWAFDSYQLQSDRLGRRVSSYRESKKGNTRISKNRNGKLDNFNQVTNDWFVHIYEENRISTRPLSPARYLLVTVQLDRDEKFTRCRDDHGFPFGHEVHKSPAVTQNSPNPVE